MSRLRWLRDARRDLWDWEWSDLKRKANIGKEQGSFTKGAKVLALSKHIYWITTIGYSLINISIRMKINRPIIQRLLVPRIYLGQWFPTFFHLRTLCQNISINYVHKWSDMKCSDVEWTDVIYVKLFYFEVKWATVNLGDKSTMYIRVTLYRGYLIVLLPFHLVCTLYCVCFNLLCNVWVWVCVGFVMCGCFVNMCTCI
jgi:hypothetical protein